MITLIWDISQSRGAINYPITVKLISLFRTVTLSIKSLFTFQNGKCHFKASDVGATETSHKDIQEGSESDLQQAAATIGPISVGIDASHSSFQLYRSGRSCSFLYCIRTRKYLSTFYFRPFPSRCQRANL